MQTELRVKLECFAQRLEMQNGKEDSSQLVMRYRVVELRCSQVQFESQTKVYI